MADEQTPAPAASSAVTDLGGGGMRFTPDGDPAGQAAREAAASGVGSPELAPAEDTGPKLPEGYETWEAYGKAVAAGTAKPEGEGKVEAPAKEEPAKGEPEAKDPAELPPELQAKLAPYDAELTEKGELSPESITKAAAEFGVTEEMVKQYIAGAQAQTTAVVAPFHEQTGGADAYREFQQWSAEGMTAAEQAELNTAYEQGGPAALALQQKYVDRWKAEGNGPAPLDLTRETKAGGGSDEAGYASLAEQKRDQADPRYAQDPAFRSKVEQKIGRTTAY